MRLPVVSSVWALSLSAFTSLFSFVRSSFESDLSFVFSPSVFASAFSFFASSSNASASFDIEGEEPVAPGALTRFRTSFATGGEQDALGQLIVRCVLAEARPQPFVVAARLRGLRETDLRVEAGRPQEIAELRRPQRGVLRPFQQLVNLARSLILSH